MTFAKAFSWPKNILVFLLFFLTAPFFSGLGTTVIFLINAAILTAFFCWLCECLVSGRKMLINVDFLRFSVIIFLAFVGYVFVQSFSGFNVFSKIMPGSVQPYETKNNAFQLLIYLFFFLLCVDFFSNRQRIFFIIPLFAVQVIFLVAVGYYQNLHGMKEIYGLYAPPPPAPFYSSFLNGNHYGVYLALLSLIFLSSIVYSYEKRSLERRSDWFLIRNIFYLVLVAVTTASIFNSDARFGFLLQLSIFAVFLLSSASQDNRKRSFIILLALSGLVFVVINYFVPNLLKQSYSELPANLSGRLLFDRETYHMYRDFPLFGSGVGAYKWFYRAYQILQGEFVGRVYAFNDHLELLAEAGAVGYLLFVLPILTVAVFSLKNCLRNESNWCRTMGIAAFVAITALTFAVLFDYYFKTPAIALLFVIYLAILVRCATFYCKETSDASGNARHLHGTGPRSNIFLILLAGVVVILASQHEIRDYLSRRVFDKIENSQRYDQQKNLTPKISDQLIMQEIGGLERAVDSNPENPLGWALLGQLYYERAEMVADKDFDLFIKKSMAAYNVATQLAPTFCDYWLALGMVKVRAGICLEGLRDMRHGVELASRNRDIILYAVMSHLKVEEFSIWESQKHEIRRRALMLVAKSYLLPNPLTVSDHDFINFRYRYWQKRVSPEDAARISALIDEFHRNTSMVNKGFF